MESMLDKKLGKYSSESDLVYFPNLYKYDRDGINLDNVPDAKAAVPRSCDENLVCLADLYEVHLHYPR